MRLSRLLAAALLAAAFAPAAAAQDVRRGADLAAQRCVHCHGENGRSEQAGIPSLAGQQALFITVQMVLFREGIRQVPAMMAFAEGLPDADIEALAAFFAGLPPGPPPDRGPRNATLFAAGQALIGPRNCAVCHLPSLAGREQIPRVSAQREDFLIHTLTEYRDGIRVGVDTQMNSAMVGLGNADIAALAHYLAQRD